MIWYLIISFAAGWYVREAVALHKIKTIVRTMQELEETPVIDELKVNIEKHDGRFYLYRDSDNLFISQGATKEEVVNDLKKRYPAQTIVVDPNNVKEVDFK